MDQPNQTPSPAPAVSPSPAASPPPPLSGWGAAEGSIVGSGLKAAKTPGPAETPPPNPIPPAPPTVPPANASVPTPPSQGFPVTAPGKKGKKVNPKTLALVGALVLLLGGSVLGFSHIRNFISSAQGSCLPNGTVEANLTPNSVEIVFQTDKACQMEVAYGTSKEALLLQVPESMASLNHRIRLTPLLASTTYYYQIVADGKKVGEARSFLTKAATPTLVPTEIPTLAPTTAPLDEGEAATGSSTATGEYALEDFQAQFGGDNSEFDIDGNGIVNMKDWLMYQKQ